MFLVFEKYVVKTSFPKSETKIAPSVFVIFNPQYVPHEASGWVQSFEKHNLMPKALNKTKRAYVFCFLGFFFQPLFGKSMGGRFFKILRPILTSVFVMVYTEWGSQFFGLCENNTFSCTIGMGIEYTDVNASNKLMSFSIWNRKKVIGKKTEQQKHVTKNLPG